MTPNFALSLSFDGIRLMHRITGGWHLVDEVSLEDPDLTAALGRLRKTAIALEPSGLRTKILLPNDQIKYLSLDTTQTTVDDVRNALHGTTPYAVDDLVIDFNRSGGRTHIAAVARETLVEAETFAKQHRFAPVTFAAVAEPYTFNTEVFFGMTKSAADYVGQGVTIARDDDPVTVIGRATMPVPATAPDAMPLTMRSEPDPVVKPAPAEQPAPMPAADQVAEDEPVVTFTRSGRQSTETPPRTRAPLLIEPSKPSLPEIDEPVFTSRQKGLAPGAAQDDSATEQPFTRRVADTVAPDLRVAEDDAPAPPVPIVAAPAPILAATAAITAPKVQPAFVIPEPVPRDDAKEPSKLAALTAMASRVFTRSPAKPAAAAVPAAIGPLGGQSAQSRGKPRFLGLMLTAGLLLFLAIVAIWASTLDEDGIAGYFGFGENAPSELVSDTAPVAPEIVPQAIIEPETVAAIQPEAVPQTPPTPIVTTVPGRVLSPGEADRIYAATGVWQRAPRLPVLPDTGSLDAFRSFNAVPVVAPITRPRDLAAAAASVDAPFLAPPNPAPAGTIIPRDADGFIVASEAGTVMPNGVIVYAKAPAVKPPVRPAALAPDVAEATEPTADVPLADSVAAAIAAATAGDNADAALAEPDAAETPEEPTAGAVLLAGLRPAIRPEGLAPQEPFADQALAGLRPALRPEGFAPPAAEEVVEEENVAAEETPAPLANDIASVVAAIAAAAPPSALVNPTRLAIVASPRPDTRPTNFSRVVASAQQNTARQQTQPAATQQASAPAAAIAASAAAVRPSGAVPQSVASAATMDSVINLRNVNLMGVYGRPNARRALIRLSNGSYVKVEVGSALEGGQVTAIGDNAINYVVRGQTYSLQVPSG